MLWVKEIWLDLRTHRSTFEFSIIFNAVVAQVAEQFVMKDKDLLILCNQYHGYWWPVSTHGTDEVG